MNITHLLCLVVIIYSSKSECAKVVKYGIEQLSLNAKRDSKLWFALGNNGTQGTQLDDG